MAEILQFTLQSILDVRSNERQQRRADMAGLVHQDAFLLASEQDVLAELADCDQTIRTLNQQSVTDVVQLGELEQRRQQLHQRQRDLAQARGKVAEQIERQRLALSEANRQVRLLEKLRKRREDEVHREQRRREARNF